MPAPLPTIPASTDLEMRREMLAVLLERLGADHGATGRIVVDGGRLVILGLVAIGPESFIAPRRQDQGQALGSLGVGVEGFWSFNTFRPEKGAHLPVDLRAKYWGLSGVHSSLAMNVGRSGQYIGYIGVFRAGDRKPFGAAELAAARAMSPWAVDVFERAIQADDTHDVHAGDYVVGEDGAVRFASGEPSAQPAGTIGRCAREFLCGARDGESIVGSWRLSMSRLVGSDAQAALVRVRRVGGGHAPQLARLSDVKRRVAALAGAGATVPEIATTIGRQPETVRAHLKDIYAALGVGSRVELAEVCRTLWSSQDGDAGFLEDGHDADPA